MMCMVFNEGLFPGRHNQAALPHKEVGNGK